MSLREWESLGNYKNYKQTDFAWDLSKYSYDTNIITLSDDKRTINFKGGNNTTIVANFEIRAQYIVKWKIFLREINNIRIGCCDVGFDHWVAGGYAIGNPLQESVGNNATAFGRNRYAMYLHHPNHRVKIEIENKFIYHSGDVLCCKMDMIKGEFSSKVIPKINEKMPEKKEYQVLLSNLPLDNVYFPAVTFYCSGQEIRLIKTRVIAPEWKKENHKYLGKALREKIFVVWMIVLKRKENIIARVPKPVVFMIFNFLVKLSLN